MTRKYLFVCSFVLFVLLALVTSRYFFPQKQQQQIVVSLSPSPVIVSPPPNRIDVFSLSKEDYEKIQAEYNDVFLIRKDEGKKQVYYNDKPLWSLALSPSQKQAAFLYLPNKQSSEELSFILLSLESGMTKQVYYAFISNMGSGIHWLGNNHLFFLSHCGTACQGITLLDIRSGKTKSGVLTYPSFPNQPAKTHFKDWFGQEFVINGLVKGVSSATESNLHYFIFMLEDDTGNFLGEKKFQFMEAKADKLLP